MYFSVLSILEWSHDTRQARTILYGYFSESPSFICPCAKLCTAARSQARNVWNDYKLFLQAERRGNKIISLLLHAHIPAKMRASGWNIQEMHEPWSPRSRRRWCSRWRGSTWCPTRCLCGLTPAVGGGPLCLSDGRTWAGVNPSKVHLAE